MATTPSGTGQSGAANETQDNSQSTQPGGNSGGGSGNDIQVLTGGSAGAVSPVVGGENLGSGSGGGVGQAAKDAARNAATKQQTPPPTEDSSN